MMKPRTDDANAIRLYKARRQPLREVLPTTSNVAQRSLARVSVTVHSAPMKA
jgi:hypothetical protein